ncbi:MAG: T9SS type A sorting domain-containing protein [Chitinivibrionales bacterium]|nr:T9SS type A sorting domain-containing protein [Chitinivibrionales bacterium]
MKTGMVNFIIGAFFIILFYQLTNAQWEQTDGPGSGAVNALMVSGTDFFAATDSGVFLSTNDGANWKAVNTGLPAKTVVYSLAASGIDIFAATKNYGVYRSSNNGAAWSAVNTGFPLGSTIACLTMSGVDLFAGVNKGGIFRSLNNGLNWAAVNTGLPDTVTVNALAVSGIDLFAGTMSKGIYYSNNNGFSWSALNSGLPGGTSVLCFAQSGIDLFAGTSRGVFHSTNNGAAWSVPTSGLPDSSVNSLATSGSYLFAGVNGVIGGGVYLSTNSGADWNLITGLPGVRSLAVNGAYVFAGMDNGFVWRRLLTGVSVKELPGLRGNGPLWEFTLPNRVHSAVTVAVNLPRSSAVSLKVFDCFGRELVVFANGNFGPGTHAVSLSTRSLPSGFYFMRMQTSTNILVKRFLKE